MLGGTAPDAHFTQATHSCDRFEMAARLYAGADDRERSGALARQVLD